MIAWPRHLGWWLAWALLSALACASLARNEMGQARDLFETDARIAHRLLSQSAVQHDAVLATLVLVQPGAADALGSDAATAPERLSAIYPQIRQVARRDGDTLWADPRDQAAEILSRATRRPVIAQFDWAQGRYRLLQAGLPSSFAITLDMRQLVPATTWPTPAGTHLASAWLELGGQRLVLQGVSGDPTSGCARAMEFRKHLAAPSQPFELVVQRRLAWAQLPLALMLGISLVLGLVLWALAFGLRQRQERARAEELLRLGQLGRLNTMGELAAGMAHELNQPLTAVMANTQAALRLLKDDPVDLPTATRAMDHASVQARRAADVIARLRRLLERPGTSTPNASVRLDDLARDVLHLLEPEFRAIQCQPRLDAPQAVNVTGDAVALSQIAHNLLMNAVHALAQVPAPERQLWVRVATEGTTVVLEVSDNGPGFTPEVAQRLFEPFFSTRPGGLGLGLSLCESLARGMGGELQADARAPRGACLRLTLRRAPEGAWA